MIYRNATIDFLAVWIVDNGRIIEILLANAFMAIKVCGIDFVALVIDCFVVDAFCISDFLEFFFIWKIDSN